MFLSQCVEKFINHQYVIGSTINTINHYICHLGIFQKFLKKDININDITYNTYEKYIIHLRNKITTKNKKMSSVTIKTYSRDLKTFLKFCYEENFMKEAIYMKIRIPKCNKPTIQILGKQDIYNIFNSYDIYTFYGSRNLLILSLMLDGGLRLSEVCNLEHSDFNFENRLIRVKGKGQKERLIPLTKNIKYYYDKYFEILSSYNFPKFINNFVLLDKEFNQITPNAIKQVIKRLKVKLGLSKLNPHYLRHNFASFYLINRWKCIKFTNNFRTCNFAND